MEVLPAAFLGLGGFINLWWLLAPYYIFHKNKPKGVWKFLTLLLYCAGILLVFGSFKVFGAFAYVATNLMMLLLMSFIFERQRGQDRFSSLSIFVIFAAITTLLYCYISSITGVVSKVSQYTSPNEVSEMIAHYDKKYAPNNDESFLMNSIWIAQQFPFVNYLKKDNFQKFHVVAIQADQGLVGSRLMFDNKDPNRVFTYSYLFDDVKKAINNPKVKVMFFNNSPDITRKEDRCLISTLEYYFLDPFFKKNFLKKFRFENHVIVSKDKRQLQKIGFISREKSSIFDQVIPSDKQIFYDFEVYVRN
jgi:hypothetical protein